MPVHTSNSAFRGGADPAEQPVANHSPPNSITLIVCHARLIEQIEPIFADFAAVVLKGIKVAGVAPPTAPTRGSRTVLGTPDNRSACTPHVPTVRSTLVLSVHAIVVDIACMVCIGAGIYFAYLDCVVVRVIRLAGFPTSGTPVGLAASPTGAGGSRIGKKACPRDCCMLLPHFQRGLQERDHRWSCGFCCLTCPVNKSVHPAEERLFVSNVNGAWN